MLSGRPVFRKYENGEFVQVDKIEESRRILKPPFAEEYPYEPYEFASIEELKSYKERAQAETVDSFYDRAKSIVKKYNDQDDHKLTQLSADIVWSSSKTNLGTFSLSCDYRR